MVDVTNLLAGSGIQLEQQAHNAFGASVDQYRGQQLSNVASEILRGVIGRPGAIHPPSTGYWNVTPYASDLVKYAPKSRFLFKVQFFANPPYDQTLFLDRSGLTLQYVVKTINKPKVTYNYEEVNMYNFRTKVLKSITHGELTLSMIDDVQNTLHFFFNEYRMALMPQARINLEGSKLLETSGMNFANPQARKSGIDSAQRGVLSGGHVNPLRAIKIYQIFGAIHDSSSDGNTYRENVFTFINPRITRFDLDESDYSTGQPSDGSIAFEYDVLYVETTPLNSGRPHAVAPGTEIYAPSNGGSSTSPGGFGLSPSVIDAAINIGARAAGNIASAGVRALGGGNPLIVGPLGYLGATVNSTVSDVTKHTLRTATQNTNQSFARPEPPRIVDNTSAVPSIKGTVVSTDTPPTS